MYIQSKEQKIFDFCEKFIDLTFSIRGRQTLFGARKQIADNYNI